MMRRFGLIGKTLKHSFSQNYFSHKFIEEGITDCSYENFELASIIGFPQLIDRIPALEGLNITIPYKEEVLGFLHTKNDIVEQVGACNCIKIVGGKLYGYNTDAIAFQKSLERKIQPHHNRALILGSGGASKAVQFALKEMGIYFLIVSRNKKSDQLGYEDVAEEVLKEHQLIINTTPLGMYPNIDEVPPIFYGAITPNHLLFDLTYNPEKTKFLQHGEFRGAQIMNGYEMLVSQAEESWRIWNS